MMAAVGGGAIVHVNVVAPGSIEFPGGAWDLRRAADPELYAEVRAGVPFGRFGTPEEVAAAVVFLASPKASWISGGQVRPVSPM